MTRIETALFIGAERFLAAHYVEVDAWAERAHAEIHAMAVARQRGIGQLARTATRRVRAITGDQ